MIGDPIAQAITDRVDVRVNGGGQSRSHASDLVVGVPLEHRQGERSPLQIRQISEQMEQHPVFRIGAESAHEYAGLRPWYEIFDSQRASESNWGTLAR